MITIGNQNFYTPIEAAEIIGCDITNVRRIIRSGQLESIKPAKSYLIPEEAFNKYMEYRRKKGRKHE